MSKVIAASDAVALIKDGATIGVSCLGLSGWAEQLAIAIEERFLECRHPAGLTFVHTAAIGDWGPVKGFMHFIHEGMVARVIGGHEALCPLFAKMIQDGGCEGYNLPLGVISQLWREIAAHRPGLVTKTGLGTFVDPRLQGGKVNKRTTKDIVEVVHLGGEEWLFYPSFPIDVAILRGTTADENGNLTVENEGSLYDILSIALAAKNSGGIVIAEVANVVKAGSLHPRSIAVPGVMIDHVIVSEPANHWQCAGTYFSPAFTGNTQVPLAGLPRMILNERLIIARRAAMELTKGANLNLGIGVPEGIAGVAAEEGISDLVTLTAESGAIGGVPGSGHNFGMSTDATAYIEMTAIFEWYNGGGLDIAFVSFAEVDEGANVNVSMFNGVYAGCGGFIDITQSAKKVVFCGSFTAGGLKVDITDGKLTIKSEGTFKKFIKAVDQITFSGSYASKLKQPVLFVSERAVLELEDGELTLIEVAPGIDIERDIMAHMDFRPKISPALQSMPTEIFQPDWGGLRKLLDDKGARRSPTSGTTVGAASAASNVAFPR